CVTPITGSDRDDVGTQTGDLVVALAQLRGMLAAVQSTEMSKEHQHDRPVAPEIAEAMRFSGTVDERRLGQNREIHTGEPIGTAGRGAPLRYASELLHAISRLGASTNGAGPGSTYAARRSTSTAGAIDQRPAVEDLVVHPAVLDGRVDAARSRRKHGVGVEAR